MAITPCIEFDWSNSEISNSAVTEGFVDIEPTDVAEVDDLDNAERTSLFYIAGYCIRSVEQNEVVYDECLSAIKQKNNHEEAKEEMISHEGDHIIIIIIIIIIRNLNRSQTEQYPNKGKTYSTLKSVLLQPRLELHISQV